MLSVEAFYDLDARAGALDQIRVVGCGDFLTDCALMGCDQQGAAKCLRSLRLPKAGARDGGADCSVGDALQCVGHWYRCDCSARARGGAEACIENRGRRQRARRIVHDHEFALRAGQFQCDSN